MLIVVVAARPRLPGRCIPLKKRLYPKSLGILVFRFGPHSQKRALIGIDPSHHWRREVARPNSVDITCSPFMKSALPGQYREVAEHIDSSDCLRDPGEYRLLAKPFKRLNASARSRGRRNFSGFQRNRSLHPIELRKLGNSKPLCRQFHICIRCCSGDPCGKTRLSPCAFQALFFQSFKTSWFSEGKHSMWAGKFCKDERKASTRPEPLRKTAADSVLHSHSRGCRASPLRHFHLRAVIDEDILDCPLRADKKHKSRDTQRNSKIRFYRHRQPFILHPTASPN